ncbi:MAG: hypothetical protein GEV11_02590 [Streptosporangiales bacterium]|nr:hypothetical protein [Streptosporangiales bacterium]
MRLDAGSAPGHVRRLVDGGRAVGLGFAVGLTHAVTPPALISAAAGAGLPLLEVPEPTPFIAIGKALHELLTAEEHEALRRPLLEYETRADLVGSLRAYLAAAGRWDAAAESLGVHRHTLRYRIGRIRDLLGRDLDDPTVRAELWLALQALDLP